MYIVYDFYNKYICSWQNATHYKSENCKKIGWKLLIRVLPLRVWMTWQRRWLNRPKINDFVFTKCDWVWLFGDEAPTSTVTTPSNCVTTPPLWPCSRAASAKVMSDYGAVSESSDRFNVFADSCCRQRCMKKTCFHISDALRLDVVRQSCDDESRRIQKQLSFTNYAEYNQQVCPK